VATARAVSWWVGGLGDGTHDILAKYPRLSGLQGSENEPALERKHLFRRGFNAVINF